MRIRQEVVFLLAGSLLAASGAATVATQGGPAEPLDSETTTTAPAPPVTVLETVTATPPPISVEGLAPSIGSALASTGFADRIGAGELERALPPSVVTALLDAGAVLTIAEPAADAAP